MKFRSILSNISPRGVNRIKQECSQSFTERQKVMLLTNFTTIMAQSYQRAADRAFWVYSAVDVDVVERPSVHTGRM